MKIKKILLTAVLSAITLTSNAYSDVERIQDMSYYVFPQNIAKSPKQHTFLPDGQSYLQLSDDGKTIGKYEIATGNLVETVLDCSKTRETKIDKIDGFIIDENATRILVFKNKEYVYRRSFTAEYYVFEIKRNILLPLSENHKRQQSPVFSPDGLMVAFVADNNIYLKKLVYNTEVAVTTDGLRNNIINGIPDWVYEEEFGRTCSMAWSPDNSTLCYIKYDESKVKTYSLPIYSSYCKPIQDNELYPGELTYKYPVAGEQNSVVSLHSYDIDTRKNKTILIDDSELEYIPAIHYAPNSDKLIVSTLNREQNKFTLYSINPKSTVVKTILIETDNAWVNESAYNDIHYGDNDFVIMSARSGYVHLYRYTYAGAMIGQLTSGNFNVTDYYGTDKLGNIYFQSTFSGAIHRTVNYIDKKTGKILFIGEEKGTNSAEFSPNMDYYMLCYSNSVTPPNYTLYSTIKHKKIREIEDNSSIAAKYRDVPHKEYIIIKTPEVELNAYIIKPSDFNENKKYPVIMNQYSGPSSQQVLDKWNVDWQQYAAKCGYIVVCVDGRGTGGRDRAFETCVYKQLGQFESADQVAAANYIAKLPYVDSANIAITGWSYGGYETLMAISTPGNPFKAAVAIAPVTDWRLYDTIYTERFMSTPQQNEDGYRTSAPSNFIKNIGETELLIMYGTSDDNVHPANTIQYLSALQAQNRFCSVLMFPNMNHSINGCNARAQVYAAMMKFFDAHLK